MLKLLIVEQKIGSEGDRRVFLMKNIGNFLAVIHSGLFSTPIGLSGPPDTTITTTCLIPVLASIFFVSAMLSRRQYFRGRKFIFVQYVA